jgi:hypothetical protein
MNEELRLTINQWMEAIGTAPFFTWALEVEIEGRWPWQRKGLGSDEG